MLNNYSTVSEFISSYISGGVSSRVLIEERYEVYLSNKCLPFILLANNAMPIDSMNRLINCMKSVIVLNPTLTDSDFSYRDITSPVNSTAVEPIDEPSRETVQNSSSLLSINSLEELEKDSMEQKNSFRDPYMEQIKQFAKESARTSWYEKVLTGELSYSDVLLQNKSALRKQRISMFIHHLCYGKTPLTAYLYGNNGYTYFNMRKNERIKEYTERYIANSLDNDIEKYLNNPYNDCDDKEYIKERLLASHERRLLFKYNVDRDYIVKGLQMLCQLFSQDVDYGSMDIKDITLSEILGAVLDLVQEYCHSHTSNIGELLTYIFLHDIFSNPILPKDKWELFRLNNILKVGGTFRDLPVTKVIFEMYGEQAVFDDANFLAIESYVNEFLYEASKTPDKLANLYSRVQFNTFKSKLPQKIDILGKYIEPISIAKYYNDIITHLDDNYTCSSALLELRFFTRRVTRLNKLVNNFGLLTEELNEWNITPDGKYQATLSTLGDLLLRVQSSIDTDMFMKTTANGEGNKNIVKAQCMISNIKFLTKQIEQNLNNL